ncbi:MAG: dihydrofolate reductase [Stappiaceae bacterium]
MISAVAENGVIGAGNDMPWNISADLRFFKRTTMHKPVVMGRRTILAIGKALPGRINIVVTRDDTFSFEGAVIVHSLEEGIAVAKKEAEAAGVDEIIIGGGGDIYRQAMPIADRLYITRVHASPEGDTKFPEIDPTMWSEESVEQLDPYPQDTARVSVVTYQRQ